MTELVDDVDLPVTPKRRLRFDWLLPMITRPAKTFGLIAKEETSTWLLPLLLLSLLALVAVLVAGPLRMQQLLSTPPQLPPDFQNYAPEQQQQILQASQPNTSPVFIYIFPAVGALVGVWLSWFLLGGMLHLALTLMGGRSTRTADFNLAAWASLPLAVRSLVQIAAMLITQRVINRPGLSGFIAADASGFNAFFASLLSLIDIYLIWQVILLVVGAGQGAGLTRSKVFTSVAIAVMVLLALQALPGFVTAQLSGLQVTNGIFF